MQATAHSTTLPSELRRQLESAVKSARDIAEQAAQEELERLSVGAKAPADYLSEEQRSLRNRLRAHGRQLGDRRKPGGEQEVSLLVSEIAYEHWHRMLFSRFLAENNLLIYEDGVTPLAISDCFDLAEEETGDSSNGWRYAANFAAKMLPQIFRVDSPVFEIELAPNHQKKLEQLLSSLDPSIFQASDSLGWVYQFWQADNKERINKSEVKIGARELPAVTQLFTEPYMVSFLLDNALGAWWAARRLTEEDLRTATSEEELRQKASIPGVPLEYLRFVKEAGEDGAERWAPAAGTFHGWPEHLGELKCLDPCCGSGHFLVSLLLMLTPLRMEMEGLSAEAAVDAVLRENLYGLELDQRCVELAAFALALNAWKYPNAGGYRKLPEIQVACSGLSISVAKGGWKALVREGGMGGKNLDIAMDWLHDTFRDAPVLGSLLNPAKTDAAKIVQWDQLSAALNKALAQETTDEQHEVAVVAHGLAKAATLLAGQYGWVVTNVPYLARGKQDDRLRDYCEKHFPAGKNDLATVFLDRCLELCHEGGSSSVVLPQNWLFLTSYKAFREKLLKQETWNIIARLGPKGFQTPMWDFNVQLITLTHGQAGGNPDGAHGGLFAGEASRHALRGVDVSEPKTAADKAVALLSAEVKSVEQAGQLVNPDARVSFERLDADLLLSEIAKFGKGSTTGDGPRFLLNIWEFQTVKQHHVYWLNSPMEGQPWSGRSQVCKVSLDDQELNQQLGCWLRGGDVYGLSGVAVNKMRKLEPFLYSGEVFDDNICPIAPKDIEHLPATWAFVESDEYHNLVRSVDQALKVTAGTITKVPFDLDRWQQISAERYPNGLPQPYTNDPTQWIFHGHPCGSVIWDDTIKWTAHGPLRTDDTVLHIAAARLLGCRWPAELDVEMELAAEQREWVDRCESLLGYADDDGIVCLPVVRSEAAADDRLEALLQAAYGESWSTQVRNQLLEAAGCKNKSLDFWLREKFFEQHCKLFQHRPFIWHIWDGLKDGFSALVNYHLLDKKNLERLIYTYLDDWIRTQNHQVSSEVDGASERLAAAQNLKAQLEKILEGEKPYDIFVRWKPLDQQPIGWEPDLNDGVRLNIRPFLSIDDVGKKGAGILRAKPNIKWTKDRGKDIESAPWYHLGPAYSESEGARINDHHLSLEEKRKARES
jgi:hypothetical protein